MLIRQLIHSRTEATYNHLGFTLVEIMIVIGIIAILAAFAIPNVLRSRMQSNDAMAQSSLQTITTAIESYVAANNGVYPTQATQLTTANPPYLNVNYCQYNSLQNAITGYYYTCTLTSSSYMVTATPVACHQSGSAVWSIAANSGLTSSACS